MPRLIDGCHLGEVKPNLMGDFSYPTLSMLFWSIGTTTNNSAYLMGKTPSLHSLGAKNPTSN